MTDKFEEIQVLFQVRNARKRGPTSSDEFNDMLEEVAHDFSTLNDQWNNRLVPLGDAIPAGTLDSSVDAYTNGLDGANLYVNHEATASSNSLYYSTSSSRPNTVFEQFGLFYTTMNEIRDDLENQINNSVLTASQISIEDTGGLYDATNVEDALAEVKTQADYLNELSFGNVKEDILPSIDNYYSIGSPTLRWKAIYVAGSSLHVVALAAEAGGTARDYSFEVDGTDGALLLKQGVSTISRTLHTGAVQLPELASDPTQQTGFGTLYTKSSDSKLYYRDSSGDITELGGGATEVNVLELAADSDNDDASSYITMTVDGTEAIRIDENQKVGIGTSSPTTELHVYNTSDPTFRLGNANNYFDITNYDWNYTKINYTVATGHGTIQFNPIVSDGSSNSSVHFFQGVSTSGSASAAFYVADSGGGDEWTKNAQIGGKGVNTFFCANNGSFGIGTTSPVYKLDVSGDVNTTSVYRIDNFNVLNLSSNNLLIGQQVAGITALYSNSTERVRIDGSGNVGIADTPRVRLHVTGPDGAGEGDPSIGSDDIVMFQNNGAAGYNCYVNVVAGTTGDAGINFGDKDDRDIGKINYNNNTDAFSYVKSSSTYLLIDSSGNVGIGTNSPDTTLHVHKATAGSVSAVSNTVLTIENDTDAFLSFLTPSTSTAAGIYWGDNFDNDRSWILYDHSNDEMKFGVNTSTKMTIDSSGQVGIGDTTPSYKLDVNGTIGAAGNIYFTSGAGGHILTNSTDGSDDDQISICAGGSSDDSRGARIALNGNESVNTGNLILQAGDGDGVTGGILQMWTGSANRMTIDDAGLVGIGTNSPDAPLEIQTASDVGVQAVTIDQNDEDKPFIDFQGATGANTTSSISTHGTPGTIQGWIQIEINGTKRWIPFYDNPSA